MRKCGLFARVCIYVVIFLRLGGTSTLCSMIRADIYYFCSGGCKYDVTKPFVSALPGRFADRKTTTRYVASYLWSCKDNTYTFIHIYASRYTILSPPTEKKEKHFRTKDILIRYNPCGYNARVALIRFPVEFYADLRLIGWESWFCQRGNVNFWGVFCRLEMTFSEFTCV